MKKINIDFAGMKDAVCEKVKTGCETVVSYVKDNPEQLFWGVMIAGLSVSYGQSIRYMHMLNKTAKNGTFKFIPGQGYVA